MAKDWYGDVKRRIDKRVEDLLDSYNNPKPLRSERTGKFQGNVNPIICGKGRKIARKRGHV